MLSLQHLFLFGQVDSHSHLLILVLLLLLQPLGTLNDVSLQSSNLLLQLNPLDFKLVLLLLARVQLLLPPLFIQLLTRFSRLDVQNLLS